MTLPRPYIILLNGVGSVGKSSIAKALQERVSSPLMHVQMDAFLEMLPESIQEHSTTFTYSQIIRDGDYEVVIGAGSVGKQLLHGMRRAVRAMAEAGLNLVVDDVLMGGDDPGFEEYRSLLSPFSFRTVGVLATLETLEYREINRGDRLRGLARWQFPRVHAGATYDLTVHSDNLSPREIADKIVRVFDL